MTASRRRTVLITGASRGIGRAAAVAAAEAGMDVIAVAHRGEDAIREVVAEVEGRGVRGLGLLADVSNPADVQRLARQVDETFGSLDALVNNAGIAIRQTLAETTLDAWNRTLAVNLTGPFLMAQAFVPLLQKGHDPVIVNVSSIAGRIGGRVGPAYVASKGGLLALTNYLVSHLKPLGIRVNGVAPGQVETDMVRELGIPPLPDPIAGVPDRFGQPEEVAEVIVFLCRTSNRFLNGETIYLTGGRMYF